MATEPRRARIARDIKVIYPETAHPPQWASPAYGFSADLVGAFRSDPRPGGRAR